MARGNPIVSTERSAHQHLENKTKGGPGKKTSRTSRWPASQESGATLTLLPSRPLVTVHRMDVTRMEGPMWKHDADAVRVQGVNQKTFL